MKRILFYNALLIVCGICCGILAYFCLSDSQMLILQNFWSQSISQSVNQMQKYAVIVQIFLQNLEDMLRIYFLGLCLIGVPLLFVFVFIQGFSLGFLCCFLGGQSVFLVIIQMLYLPVYLGEVSLATSFAHILLRNQVDNPWRQIIKYTAYFLLLTIVVFIMSCLDGLFSIYILKKII